MSDIYEVLRRRVQTVAANAQIGTERLQAAQDAAGYSNERLARALNISEKTWRRWKSAGTVPVYHLDAVAAALDLEIERPEGSTVRMERSEVRELRREMAEIRAMIATLIQRTA